MSFIKKYKGNSMYRVIFSSIVISLFLLFSVLLNAGDNFIEIKGIIMDSNSKPIPYVFISVENTSIKIVSNIDGSFILRLPNDVIFPIKVTFTSVNYIDKSLSITKANYKKLQNVKLTAKENYKVAYEKKKKTDNTKREAELKKYRKGKDKLMKKSGKAIEEYKAVEFMDMASTTIGITEGLGGFSADITLAEPSISKMKDELAIDRSELSHSMSQAEAGKLTAGELNDFTKWKLWEDIGNTDLQVQQDIWKIYPNERYVAQLTNLDGMAIVNAKVTLKDNQGNNIWQTYTDNTGKAELWANILTDSVNNTGTPYYIEFEYQKQTKTIEAVPFYDRINTAEISAKCSEVNAVDIDFVVDATGSMGDEIKYLQEELYDVMRKFQANNPQIDLRTGSIFYRDFGDEYIVRKSDFSNDINKTIDFIKEQSASGGGDYPEAVDVALYASIENRDWRENTLSKIIFLVLDAPPHSVDSCIQQMQRQIRIAAMKGIRIVPLVCSGTDKSTEYLMRAIALATNGTYVFLTDESGIGDAHIKPTTDKYEVEKLNHILLRVITEFSSIQNCNNDWVNNFDSTINDFDKYLPKPYKDNPDSTERVNMSTILNAYPMPCYGVLDIDVLQNISHIYLADLTGKVLQNLEDVSNNFQINMNGYANGIYFINAYYGGRWYSMKFVLSK